MLIEKVAITRLVVNPIDDRAKVEPGVGLAGPEWDWIGRQPVTQADWPEAGLRALTRTANQDRVGAWRSIFRRHRPGASEQVDLHHVNRTIQEVGPFGQVASPVFSGLLVRRTQQLENGDHLPTRPVQHFQE